MSKNTEKTQDGLRLLPLHDGGVVAPAAGLLTLFAVDEDLNPGEFRTSLMRQLLQTLSASMLQDRPSGVEMEPEWDEDAAFREHYTVPPQLLADLLSRWVRLGWLKERELPNKKRDRKVYRLTILGTAELMTLIYRCQDGVVHHMFDRMLLSLYVARSFPLERLTKRVPKLERYLDGQDRIAPCDWNWKKMRNTFRQALRNEEKHLERLVNDLKPAVDKLRTLREAIEARTDLRADALKVDVTQEGGGETYTYDGDALPMEGFNYYVPGLLAFRNQRDRRTSWEMGLQPLLNFYRNFDHEFIEWHLTHGVRDMRKHIYEAQQRYVHECAEILRKMT